MTVGSASDRAAMAMWREPFRGMTSAVFLFALMVRAGYWADITADPERGFFTYNLVRGAPMGDAWCWDVTAADLAAGRGVPGFYAGRRPLYPLVVALVYQWTGPSLAIAQWLNMLASAASVALLFRIGSRVFDWPVGLMAALWLTFEPQSLSLSCTTMTESMGLLCLFLHFDQLLSGGARGGWSLLASGGWLALSNLIRTMTVFALPGEMLGLLFIGRHHGQSWSAGVRNAGGLALGFSLMLAPFIVRQGMKTGIWSLSDNSSQMLFAATSPEHGYWTSALDRLADREGLWNAKDRYDYFLREAKANFRAHPRFYVENGYRNLRVNMHYAAVPLAPGLWKLAWALTLCLFLAVTLWRKGSWLGTLIGSSLVLAGVWWAPRWLDGGDVWLFAAVATLASTPLRWIGKVIITRSNSARGDEADPLTPAFFLANLAATTILAMAGLACTEKRFIVLSQWSVICLAFGGAWEVIATLGRSKTPLTVSIPEPQSPLIPWLARHRRRIALIATAALLVSLLRLFADNVIFPERKLTSLPIEPHSLLEAIEETRRRIPEAFLEQQIEDDHFFPLINRYDKEKDCGRLIVMAGQVDRHICYFPEEMIATIDSPGFDDRTYERSVFTMARANPTLWPGAVPRSFRHRDVVVIGRLNTESSKVVGPILIEAMALFPYDPDSKKVVVDKGVFVSDPRHLDVLKALSGREASEATARSVNDRR